MIYQWSIKNAIAGFCISNHFRHSNCMEGKSYLFLLFSGMSEPVLLNVYGAPALTPRNEFRQSWNF